MCPGLNEPQAPALPHVAVQSTPLLAGSFVTVAATFTGPLTFRLTGGAIERATATGAPAITVMVAEADLLGSAVEVAVRVTVFPAGTLAGAV